MVFSKDCFNEAMNSIHVCMVTKVTVTTKLCVSTTTRPSENIVSERVRTLFNKGYMKNTMQGSFKYWN